MKKPEIVSIVLVLAGCYELIYALNNISTLAEGDEIRSIIGFSIGVFLICGGFVVKWYSKRHNETNQNLPRRKGSMFIRIVGILDVIIVLFIILVASFDKLSHSDSIFFVVLSIIVFPNMVAIFMKTSSLSFRDNFIVLYFKRKALEEKKKIEELNKVRE